jgi:hypothetical protein
MAVSVLRRLLGDSVMHKELVLEKPLCRPEAVPASKRLTATPFTGSTRQEVN